MTPTQAENKVAEYLSRTNAFVTLLKKGIDGNQPFDLVAISPLVTLCLDVKLCQKDYFTFDRVEENQKKSFEYLHSLENPAVRLGFAIVYNGKMYYLDYNRYVDYQKENVKSVKTEDMVYWGEI